MAPFDGSIDKGMRPALACLQVAASMQGIALDPNAVKTVAADSRRVNDVVAMARRRGMRGRIRRLDDMRAGRIRLPALIEWPGQEYQLLIRMEPHQLVLFDPASPERPRFLRRDAFEHQAPLRLIELDAAPEANEGKAGFGLLELMRPLLAQRAVVWEILAASLVMQLFALAIPLFSQVIIDKVLNHRNLATLQVLGMGMIVLVSFEATFSVLRARLLSSVSSRIDTLLGLRVVRHLLRLPLPYFESRTIGALLSQAREMESIRQILAGSSLSGLVDLIFTVVFLAVMFSYSPTLSLLVLMAVPVLVAFSLAARPVMRRALASKHEMAAKAGNVLLEMIAGIHAIKALAIETAMLLRWQQVLSAQAAAARRANGLSSLNAAFNLLVQRAVVLAALWLGAYLALDGELSVGQVIAFQMLSLRFIHPMTHVVQVWQELQQLKMSSDALGEIMTKSHYHALTNSCVDFVWKGLQQIGMNPTAYEGHTMPMANRDDFSLLKNPQIPGGGLISIATKDPIPVVAEPMMSPFSDWWGVAPAPWVSVSHIPVDDAHLPQGTITVGPLSPPIPVQQDGSNYADGTAYQ